MGINNTTMHNNVNINKKKCHRQLDQVRLDLMLNGSLQF